MRKAKSAGKSERRREYRRESRYPASVHAAVTAETLARIEAEADQRGVGVSQVVREVIDAGLRRRRKPKPSEAIK